MADFTHLHDLLQAEYGLDATTFAPVHLFESVGRGIYRVALPGQETFLLRAYQQEKVAIPWLTNSAAILLYLERNNFPAPRMRCTMQDDLIGYHRGWSTLLLTYVVGERATGTVTEFQRLGSLLAQLHCLPNNRADKLALALPFCRWQPNQKIVAWLSALHAVAAKVPQELRGQYHFSEDVLSQVVQWSDMPTALLHADPNTFNAICTAPNDLVLIDWDGAGIGPAILDLGYLLLTAHAVLPAWPQINPNVAFIESIMHGYCAIRPLTQGEQQVLPIATCFNDAVWAAQAIPQGVDSDWSENRTLAHFGARYQSLAAIGQLSQQSIG